MKKKLIIYYALTAMAALFLMFGLGLLVTRNNNYEQAKATIAQLATAYAENYKPGNEFILSSADGVRLTVVDAAGNVIADSLENDVSVMENHINRDEIQAALRGESQAFMRESETLGVKMMYYARKVPVDLQGNRADSVDTADSYVFVRVAIKVETLNSYAAKTIPLMLMILFGSLCAAVLAGILFSDNALKPLKTVKSSLSAVNKGIFVKIPPTTGDENLNKMLVDINDISERLYETISTLDAEKGKLDYILNNVSDGIVAFDDKGNIMSANVNALSVFNLNENVIGKDVNALTADEYFIKNVNKCVKKGEDEIFEFSKGGKYFLCSVRKANTKKRESDNGLQLDSAKTQSFANTDLNKPAEADGESFLTDYNPRTYLNGDSGKYFTKTQIIILVMSDVTAAKNSERLRSQFFENAGHELKTPLTSIKGFNEMLMLKNKDAGLDDYIQKISRETERMRQLLDDMLKLSRLEHIENDGKTVYDQIDAAEIAKTVCENLQSEADKRNVSLSFEGEGKIAADKQHIYELMKNLAENAVKYNKDGGAAVISIKQIKKGTAIRVSDNGIGIDAAHQSRIFERFYRVEQSRSRETGGTGLGLAIVKHIAEIYGADIKLASKVGEGTKVTVFFRNVPQID